MTRRANVSGHDRRSGRGRIDRRGYIWLYVAMKSVRIAELKDRLSEHLRAVEGGAEVVVTDRNRPIARIVPVERSTSRVRVLRPDRDFAEVRDRRRVRAAWAVDSTTLLLEERGDR